MHFLTRPWPWYVAGPLLGLFVPILLLLGNRQFGVSGSLRALCAATFPMKAAFLRYDWKKTGAWNIAFAVGIVLGGFIAARLLGVTTPAVAGATRDALAALGIHEINGLAPAQLFSWTALLTWRGILFMVVGGFLVGFGSTYAGGCTSGHGIAGLASFQLPSLVAVIGFFVGGLLGTFVVLPRIL